MTDDELSRTYTLYEARAAGLTRAQLRDDGIRVSRGVYVSRAVPLTLRAAARALVRYCRTTLCSVTEPPRRCWVCR
jgi:hypothetical protein